MAAIRPNHVRSAISVGLGIAVAISVFAGVRFAVGDSDEGAFLLATPDPQITPAPPADTSTPKPEPVPTWDPQHTPPPIPIGNVKVPVPPRATVSSIVSDPPDPDLPKYIISRGSSEVRFNERGLVSSNVLAEDRDDFQPTLDAIDQLSTSSDSSGQYD